MTFPERYIQRVSKENLLSLLSLPTAPFREMAPAHWFARESVRARLPFFQDRFGNLVMGVRSPVEYKKRVKQKTKNPLFVFVAHLDHPGFHGARWSRPNVLEFRWLGGGPVAELEGAGVWLKDSQGRSLKGKIERAKLHESGAFVESGTIVVPSAAEIKPETLYGGMDFEEPTWQEGTRIFCRAADDLVGAFVAWSTCLAERSLKGRHGDALAVLTRGEEVGFIGAIAHFELDWLTRPSRPTFVVSLETSRTLPGAEIGKGPIVRLGDRATIFDAGGTELLTAVAKSVLDQRFQRRVMDGGSCEATAANAFGLTTIAMSIPLGNYHNQSLEGGTRAAGPKGPAPEFVDWGDVEGMLAVTKGLLAKKQNWADPFGERRRALGNQRKRFANMLKHSLNIKGDA